jgi:deazaflavin-dependent oxidoreductase (nitroreductase family)
MKVVSLTTFGRKSGEPRTVLLTSPVQDGESFVVVASRGGDDTHPAWFVNLRENPSVGVAIGIGSPEPWIARIATDAERERLWPQVVSRYPGYGRYQRRTDRLIPLVLLSPSPPDRSGRE